MRKKVSVWLGCCVIMIGNSTSQKVTGRWRGHLIQTFRSNPGSSSVRKDNVTKLAHLYRTPDSEPWWVPLTIRVQPLDLPTETCYSLTTLMLHHAFDILYMCIFWHCYYCYSSIIVIIITIIPFLTSQPFTNSRWFCNIIFSHWWGPWIGSKRLNQVTSTSFCDS